VTDSTTHQPIAGAQVQLVGLNRTTTADASGVYSFSGVPTGTVSVRVQRIGFARATRDVIVSGGDVAAGADFSLLPLATTLSQVVVVGYGSRSRAEVTGAVSSVAANQIVGTPIAGVDAMLQGKVSGVQVTQNAGNPGNGISVRIRGASSVSATNQPLYVVDGVPIQQDDFSQLGYSGQNITAVTTINPDEIESITLLKDAAAAAIYGSRASNGVIMITTRRGSAGKTRISYSAYTGRQTAEKKLSMLNGKQYVEYMAEGAVNDGYDPADYDIAPGINDAVNTDWQDAIFRTAPISDANLAVTGGTDRVKYYVSGSYFGQEGVVVGSSYNRSSGRANLDFDATDRLSFSTSIALSRENNYRIQGDASLDGIVTNAIGNQPNYTIRNADGSFRGPGDSLVYSNPLALAAYDYSPTLTQRALANVEARYNVMRGVQFTGRVGGDQLVLHERQWQSPIVGGTYAASVNGVAKSGYSTGNRFLGEGFFTITPWSGSTNGTFSATVGASTERNRSELNFVRGEGFSNPNLHDVGNATTVTDFDASRSQNNLLSYFTRANLDWGDRYLATASLRADGSSKFGQNNRYGVFPAVSVGWVITQEPFFSRLAGLGALKLRASYGVTGNQGISNSAYLATYGSANYGSLAGTSPSNFGNPNLKWESTKETNLGFDWNVLAGRVGLVADYYNKKTSNLLVSRPITGTSGFTSFTDNVGNIENRGVELELTTENIRSSGPGGFSWESNFNFSTNRNRVTALYGNQPLYGGVRSVNSVRVGEPLGAFFLLRFKGVDPQTGDAIYDDINKDGSITADDRVVGGSPQPTHWGGFNNTFAFGNFDLRAALQFSGGNKIFNAMRIFADDGGYNYDNKFTDVLRRWQKPGDITDEPRASFDGLSGARQISTRFLENGSYTRLQEVTLGFKLPASMGRRAGLEAARLYVSGRNLHTFTGYSGYNPDVNSSGSSSSIGLGSDFYAYPLARTWMLGLTGEW
jgi:TonB-linked SusC/RagA family outer membrane protein